jgi:hypothetical protein
MAGHHRGKPEPLEAASLKQTVSRGAGFACRPDTGFSPLPDERFMTDPESAANGI